MKIKLLFIFALVLFIQCCECGSLKKFRRDVSYIDSAKNKTLEFGIYLKDKARSLWNYRTVVTDTIDDKASKIKRKLNEYIAEAQKKATNIFDAIAPEIPSNDFNCRTDDPAMYMDTPQLITLHGYYSESHVVVTEDGYMLTVHRIPYSRKSLQDSKENAREYSRKRKVTSKTVLLHHGLLGSSADWVLSGPRNSLAFILSDAGYDVWIANVRGNTYSRAHVHRSIDSEAFWNFSFHEVAKYDLPAVIDYIINTKGDAKINYVGFSMGTTALFALLSTKEEYNAKLNAGFVLAPIAYMSEVKSPFKLLSKAGNTIGTFLKLVGANEFLPRNAAMRYLSKHACDFVDFQEALCEVSMFVLCGHDNEHFDTALMPIILGHVPAGASTKTLSHYAQEINSGGRFQQFDYGIDANLERYGSETPPEYAVSNITLPISMISGKNDWLSSISDAKQLFTNLGNPKEHYIIEDDSFNHLDFVFARDARTFVYDKLVEMIRKFNM